MIRLRSGACLLVTLLFGGCLASKGDVALLQTDIRALQQQSAQSDAQQRARVEQVLAQLSSTADSLRVVSARMARLQSDVQTDHYEMGRQILQIQELSGQSQRRLQELRASLEERAGAPAGAAAGSAPATAPANAGAPGPAQLFQGSVDQLRRGSPTVARSGFEELLRTYPTSEDAPEAMIYIAETYVTERNQVAADSVYRLVLQRYPKSPRAATAR